MHLSPHLPPTTLRTLPSDSPDGQRILTILSAMIEPLRAFAMDATGSLAMAELLDARTVHDLRAALPRFVGETYALITDPLVRDPASMPVASNAAPDRLSCHARNWNLAAQYLAAACDEAMAADVCGSSRLRNLLGEALDWAV